MREKIEHSKKAESNAFRAIYLTVAQNYNFFLLFFNTIFNRIFPITGLVLFSFNGEAQLSLHLNGCLSWGT